MIKLSKAEKDKMRQAIQEVHDSLKQRCQDAGLDEIETHSVLYTIQDFCGDVDYSHEGGLDLPKW